MNDAALHRLSTAANHNTPSPAAASAFPPEFFTLAERVLTGREAYRLAGLSRRGARVLQALNYLAPSDLPSPKLGPRACPTLLERAAAVPGCGPRTLGDLRRWLSEAW